MIEIYEHKRTLGLILITVLLVLEFAVLTEADSIVVDKLAALSDKLPNNIAGFDVRPTLGNRRRWRIALMLHLAPKVVYHRLRKKYRRQINKNKYMQMKYRTIVPVSIVPGLVAGAIFNRERHSEYYLVGPDESVKTNDIKIPNEFKEIPKDETMKNIMKYKHT